MEEQAKPSRQREDRIVIVFGVVGPLIGYIAMVLLDFSSGDPQSMFRNLAREPWMLIAASLYGYLFGGLPALFAGWAAAKLPRSLHPAMFVLACGLAGVFATAIFYIASLLTRQLDAWVIPAIGGLAGLICGAITLRMRES
jgi:hypothetical protein